jgi:uncharacterized protein GlcG (DUF336 family)
VSLAAARALISAATQEAERRQLPVTVAVVDCEGNLKAFERLDHAALLTVDTAIGKAWTAACSTLSTKLFGELAAADPAMDRLSRQPKVVALGGGLPIADGDAVVGGVGVSGGTEADDMAIAQAAIDGLDGA